MRRSNALTCLLGAVSVASVLMVISPAAAQPPATTAAPPVPGTQQWYLPYDNVTFWGLPKFGGANQVFICADATVLAINRITGQLQWSYHFPDDQPAQYIDVSATAVFVASNTTVYGLSIFSGYLLWSRKFVNPSPAIPARVTYANKQLFMTVENGVQSTPLIVMDPSTGDVTFTGSASELATTRLWYLKEMSALVYVEQNPASPNVVSLVARSVSSPYTYLWTQVGPSASFNISLFGGSVALTPYAIVVMMQGPRGATGVGRVDATTGMPVWRNFQNGPIATNNFDYSTTNKGRMSETVVFTIESFGAPAFAQSIISGYAAATGASLWNATITSGAPNLVPSGVDAILAQGSQNLFSFDALTGVQRWTMDFNNPQNIIGDAEEGLFVIGNNQAGTSGVYGIIA